MRKYYDKAAGVMNDLILKQVFRNVYAWMGAGLLVSAIVAACVANIPALAFMLNPGVFLGFMLVELILVFVLGFCINKMSATAAKTMYMVYTVLSGVTLSVCLLIYTPGSVVSTFFITAAMFGGLALYGTCTDTDLSKMGSICYMALWGLIAALIVNLFIMNSVFDLIISIVGVILFTGLTMYDAQKIKELAYEQYSSDEDMEKVSVMGALTMYLDFVNLFLYLLRFFGIKAKD